MSQVLANFEFLDGEHQDITFPCNPKKAMSNVIDLFKDKVKSEIELKDYLFYYKKKEIDPKLTVSQYQNAKTIINISVRKKSKIVKCPQCVANTCFLEIENFGLHFHGCPNNHDIIKTFSQYKESQKLNFEEIICDKNGETRDEVKEMYKCLTCSSKNKASYYVCNNCLNSHISKGDQNHKPINYDLKNYFCLDNCAFSSYCEKCKIDLCLFCETQHQNHKEKIIKYDDITHKIEKRKDELKEIKKKIEDSEASILQLLKVIENAYKILINYHAICKDIIDKYEAYNIKSRNYHIIKNIDSLEKSNKEVIEYLNCLITEDNSKKSYYDKCKLLIDIYYKERKNYAGKNIKDNNNPQKKEDNNNNNLNSISDKKNGISINNNNE